MRVRDIKEGMKVRVKTNAMALTTSASPCWTVRSLQLEKLQGKIGTVLRVDIDKTIMVLIDGEHRDDWSWFDAVHLEADTDVECVDVIIPIALTRKEELARIINEAVAVIAASRKELDGLDNIFSCDEIRGGVAKDGVYSISGTKSMCLVINKVAFFVSGHISGGSTYDLLDTSWASNKFTLSTLKPFITFK